MPKEATSANLQEISQSPSFCINNKNNVLSNKLIQNRFLRTLRSTFKFQSFCQIKKTYCALDISKNIVRNGRRSCLSRDRPCLLNKFILKPIIHMIIASNELGKLDLPQ